MAIDIEKLAQMGSMAATGGYAQAALGGAQAIYGLTQLPKAKAEFERARAAAPSLETPAQFYENYKNAYDSTMARMQNDAIQANLATSVQALQGAGGRALVGGLNQATAQAQASQNQMLAQERQMRMAAGQQLAQAQERSIGRKEARSQQEIAYANQAYQAALSNIGSGIASAGEGLMYGLSAAQGGKGKPATEAETKPAPPADMDFVQESRDLIAKEKGGTIADARAAVAEASKPDILKAPTFNQPIMETPSLIKSRDPVGGSPIPLEYRNDQAMKQLDALQKGYNMVSDYNKYFGVGASQLAKANNIKQNVMPILDIYNKFFENGGMMTNGAFNHNTNPIDLMQNGQKVGEATGGEYILNPTQAAAIAKQSSFARKLFKKFEKNAKKNK